MSEHRWDLTPAEMLAVLWEKVHADCDAPWYCVRCDRPVCPRCEPSPGEQELCPECWWLNDDGSAA